MLIAPLSSSNAPVAATTDAADMRADVDTDAAVATFSVVSYALGDLDVSPSQLMHFVVPLGGFPTAHDYVLLPAAREGLWWLQAADDPALTFLLADPFLLDETYCIDLGDVERATLRLQDASDALGLVMITLPCGDDDGATANCKAPLMFNLAANLGLQVLNRDEGHEVRRPADLSVYRPRARGVRMR